MQLALLARYVSSFKTVGSFEEAVWLLKARQGLEALSATSVIAEAETPFITLAGQV